MDADTVHQELSRWHWYEVSQSYAGLGHQPRLDSFHMRRQQKGHSAPDAHHYRALRYHTTKLRLTACGRWRRCGSGGQDAYSSSDTRSPV